MNKFVELDKKVMTKAEINMIMDQLIGINIDLQNNNITVSLDNNDDLVFSKYEDNAFGSIASSVVASIVKPFEDPDDYQDSLIDVCIHVCADRFKEIIEKGVNNEEKITNIVLKCCAELSAIVTRVSPIIVSSGGSDFYNKMYLKIYPDIVKRINSLRKDK